jgi:hypothetical protein
MTFVSNAAAFPSGVTAVPPPTASFSICSRM